MLLLCSRLLNLTSNYSCFLRREVYHIQRELLRERTRCKALEEELENPGESYEYTQMEEITQIRLQSD